MNKPLRVTKIAEKQYAVDGTPSDCVNLAVNGILPQRPDIVVSGINQGGNLGDDITYSGTVNCALEGTLLGIPSIAVSLDSRTSSRFDPAAEFARKLTVFVSKNGLPTDTFLNVNVPDIPAEEIKSYKITRQGKRIYRVSYIEHREANGDRFYLIKGEEPGWEDGEETDFEALAENCISITPLHLDLTNHASLSELQKWHF